MDDVMEPTAEASGWLGAGRGGLSSAGMSEMMGLPRGCSKGRRAGGRAGGVMTRLGMPPMGRRAPGEIGAVGAPGAGRGLATGLWGR
jgi:hypothetical protein